MTFDHVVTFRALSDPTKSAPKIQFFFSTLLNVFLECSEQSPKSELRAVGTYLPYKAVSRHLPVHTPCHYLNLLGTVCS